MKSILSILALLFGVGFASAGSKLDTAINHWLQGDDANSLPMMAELARQGDVNARLLLGRIEVTDRGLSPYRMSLTTRQARELFRHQDENLIFARSWLAIEADRGNPLADAFLRARGAKPDPMLIATLAALGETQATDHPTRILALYGDNDARLALAASSVLLPELRPYLAYLTHAPEPRGDGVSALRHVVDHPGKRVDATDHETLAMAELLALGIGFGNVSQDNKWRPMVERWLLSAPATRPIADLCRAACPGQVGSCAMAFMALSGGYYEVIRLDSPLEAVIPQERFLHSPRARLMTLRRAALARSETNAPFPVQEVARISTCAADVIEAERQAYR